MPTYRIHYTGLDDVRTTALVAAPDRETAQETLCDDLDAAVAIHSVRREPEPRERRHGRRRIGERS